MKTEPNVLQYTTHAKERICHCLSKVRKMPLSLTEHHSTDSTLLQTIFYPIKYAVHFKMKKYGLVLLQDQQGAKAVPVCSEVLSSDPQNVNALKDRAEAYLQDEQYENGKSMLL